MRRALDERGLLERDRQRPAYQRHDDLGWIAQAKREETKQKRLAQMLDALERGGVYMEMERRPGSPTRSGSRAARDIDVPPQGGGGWLATAAMRRREGRRRHARM